MIVCVGCRQFIVWDRDRQEYINGRGSAECSEQNFPSHPDIPWHLPDYRATESKPTP